MQGLSIIFWILFGMVSGFAMAYGVYKGVAVATLYYWKEPYDGDEDNLADEVCFRLEWDVDPVELVDRKDVRIKIRESHKNPALK